MLQKFVSLTLFLLFCSLLVILILLRSFEGLNYSEFEAYAVNMTYSTYGCASIKNNETFKQKLVNYVKAIKNMGFKGVGVAELECYYLDNYLTDYLDLLKNESLKAAIYFMWRDFTIQFQYGEPNAIPNDFWKPKDFPDNSTKADKWIEWIENVTKITRNYENVEFYLLFMPFRWQGNESYQANFHNYTGYRYYMQKAVNAIKTLDNKTLLLVSDGIELEDSSLIAYIPYDLYNIDGYGFTYYTRTPNTFEYNQLKEISNLYQDKIKENLNGKGCLFIAEWGWQTSNPHVYGRCYSEIDKVRMIKETVKGLLDLKIKYWSYFAIQDFPSENADFGLVYDNFTYKPSGDTMKQILSGKIHENFVFLGLKFKFLKILPTNLHFQVFQASPQPPHDTSHAR